MRRLAAAAFALAAATSAGAAERLTVATWNLEWMMRPAVFDDLATACFGRDARPGGGERAIPCDLVPGGRWSEADLARLRAFAAGLPADVIALQEIDGEDIAREIFPAHAFCFTGRKQVQNVGFAIRKGLKFRCNRDYQALGLPGNEVRWGADVTLEPGTAREFRLLAVHLKASCSRDPLTEAHDDCRLLQRQVPVLEEWIDRRARVGEAFGVVGDFNQRRNLLAHQRHRMMLGACHGNRADRGFRNLNCDDALRELFFGLRQHIDLHRFEAALGIGILKRFARGLYIGGGAVWTQMIVDHLLDNGLVKRRAAQHIEGGDEERIRRGAHLGLSLWRGRGCSCACTVCAADRAAQADIAAQKILARPVTAGLPA